MPEMSEINIQIGVECSRLMDKKLVPIIAVITAASLWGVIGVFSRHLVDAGLTSAQVTEVRCMVVAATLAVILLFYDRSLFKINIKDIWMFFGTGVVGIVLFNILYFSAAELVSLSMTAVLLYTAPFFVLIISAVIFKEKLTNQKILSLIFAFAGCLLISGVIGASQDFNMTGFLLGLGSGIGYALYTILGKIALKKYHPFTMTFYTFLIAGICLFPFCDPLHIFDVAINVDGAIFWMLGLGILITTIPYFLYNYGLKGMDAGVASVIAFIEPMVATIAGFVIYDEEPTVLNLIGIVLIIAAVILLNMRFGARRYHY